MASHFLGPLFVIGMPRSGTKLMRALLNQHPSISLTLAESHFIPFFVKKFSDSRRLDSRKERERFIKTLQRTAFYSTMRKLGYSLDVIHFFDNIDIASWNTVFEHVFRHFGDEKSSPLTIWGDKTPGYINHIPFLKSIFPTARFIHMIRDPRD